MLFPPMGNLTGLKLLGALLRGTEARRQPIFDPVLILFVLANPRSRAAGIARAGFSILFSTFDLPNPNDDQIRRYQEAR